MHIINQSSLINTYRSVYTNIEKNFEVTANSTWHAPTNLANMLQELQKKIWIYHFHHWVPGSDVDAEVLDIFNNGLAEYYQGNDEEINLENRNMQLVLEDFEVIWYLM